MPIPIFFLQKFTKNNLKEFSFPPNPPNRLFLYYKKEKKRLYIKKE